MTPEEHKVQKPIHDKAVHAVLSQLAEREAAFAMERYGYYHSPHEGLAIIEEEAAEAKAEYDDLDEACSDLRCYVRFSYANAHANTCDTVEYLYGAALNLAREAIHVAATAQRFLQAMEAQHAEFAHLEDKTK